MRIIEKVARFVQKPLPDQWAAIRATLVERRRLHRLTGAYAPPKVLRSAEKIYIAHRPDSDVFYKRYPEIAQLSELWIKNNLIANASDLPRLYALILNIKQVLDENIMGDMAELGVYRGNSAAVLAYYARIYHRRVLLFDTFRGFDQRDLVGVDESKPTNQSLRAPLAGVQARLNGRVWSLALAGEARSWPMEFSTLGRIGYARDCRFGEGDERNKGRQGVLWTVVRP